MDPILSTLLMAMACLALGLATGAFLMRTFAYKLGYQTARREQLQELEQWKSEALQSRLQLSSMNTVF